MDLQDLRQLRTPTNARRRPAVFWLFASIALLLTSSVNLAAQYPPVKEVLPQDFDKPAVPTCDQLDFNLDGTLSMRGYAHAAGGKFAQLLQDLDLAFSRLWSEQQVQYFRFGGNTFDPIVRPVYVAASRGDFYKGGKQYERTEIENVFRKSAPHHLKIVMTDLFEQDLNIESIKQSLSVAGFPGTNTLAVWQWQLPFEGTIYDYDFRTTGGRPYKGQRFLYMLAIGPPNTLSQLNAAVQRTVTIGKANYLLLGREALTQNSDWLRLATYNNVALKSHASADGDVPAAYRLARGCDNAGLTLDVQLHAPENTATTISFPGNYGGSLFKVWKDKTRWQAGEIEGPSLGVRHGGKGDKNAHEAFLNVKLSCGEVDGAGVTLLRISRVGADDDIELPAWVDNSSSTNAQFNDPANLQRANWGERTLNLKPFLREVATAALKGTVMATAYFYVVGN